NALAHAWIKVAAVQSLLEQNRVSLARSVKRLITQKVNDGLYPYTTLGKSTLFFGRTPELKRLTSGNTHSGIVMGAHHSGKTSLLHKLKEELPRHDRIVLGPTGGTTYQEFFEHVEDLLIGLRVELRPSIGIEPSERLTVDNFDRT